jgi:hypothetical protein
MNLESDLSLYYTKAKESLKECIQNEENEFLRDELSIPFNDILVIEKDIKIVFSKRAFVEYKIEVCLLLFEGNKEVGKYIYIENDKKEGVDDSLVLY